MAITSFAVILVTKKIVMVVFVIDIGMVEIRELEVKDYNRFCLTYI